MEASAGATSAVAPVPKILLIDDTFDSAEPLARLLRLKGHTIVTSPDGLAALSALPQFAPDLILLDLNMPRLDGVGFLRHLRTDPAYASWKNTPVILTTATASTDALRAASAFGVAHCLTKSTFTIDELDRCIRDALTPRSAGAAKQE
jgi:two-component system, OmpR family, alkaline phosphatase synthesis response regulator PhoP